MMELSHQQTSNNGLSLESMFSRQLTSPINNGNGITHNITRMLSGNQQPTTGASETLNERLRTARYSPYVTAYTRPRQHASHQISQSTNVVEPETSEAKDVEKRQGTPNSTDTSMTSLESLSPISSSSIGEARSLTGSDSDPQTDAEVVSFPASKPEQKKKLVRTNYTKEQLEMLVKIFQENPYPDSEMMENIAKDFGVKEINIKIWFQNKRARWRRRVENKNNSMQSYTPAAPMMLPYVPYGPMHNHMTSQQVSGYQNYPWVQTSAFSTNNNNHLLPGNSCWSSSFASLGSQSVQQLQDSTSLNMSSKQHLMTSHMNRNYFYPQNAYSYYIQ